MLRRVLVTAVSTALSTAVSLGLAPGPAVPSATAVAPAARPSSITGTWQGAVQSQDGPAGYGAQVRIRRTDDGLRARVRYDAVGTATWSYRGREGGWYTFRERFRPASRQAAPVLVEVRRDGPRLEVRWRDVGTGYTGHMSARRS